MERAFLAWVAALAATSWSGMVLAEGGVFRAWAALGLGALAALATLASLRGGGSHEPARARWLLPSVALLLTATLLPAVDTTLLSQDASIHRASGRWLARSGTLGIDDRTFVTLGEQERLDLFGGASVSPQRISLTRLPGGVVLPDTVGTVAYPSFSHLLAVWVAIADGVGGTAAIALLGPLFAFSAWWAIGLIALLDAGLLAALAAPLLLASLLPEHWFARYLMPEILAQALVWSGVAAARLAETGWAGAASRPAERGRLVAGILCGVALGVSGFARLEQFWVFVPALLLARALLPRGGRLFPRGALLPFALFATHAVLHAFIVPTDYANRIYKVAIHAYAPFVVFVSGLTGHDGYVTGFLLNRVLPLAVVTGLVLWVWLGRRVDRRRPGFFVRWSAAAVALPWLALLYRSGLPVHFAALRSLLLYVPWTVWGAVGLGALRVPRWSGLELAVLLQALDQLVQARVTDHQPWASRRIVTVVLPIVVLAAVRALAAARDQRAGASAAAPPGVPLRPATERRVGAALLAVTVVLGAARIAPVLGRPLQQGGEELVARVGAAVPDSAYVLVAEPLGWVHVAAALWLGEGPATLVARSQPWFPPALARFLALRGEQPVYVLSGAVAPPGEAPDPRRLLPPLPPELTLEPVTTFEWRTSMLESTVERRPETIGERSLALELYRLRPPR
jgi:hypothetical protein